MEFLIEEITVGKRFRQYPGDIDSLAESIEKVGLLSPITITADRKLICGHRRIEACKKLGLLSIPCHVAESLGDIYSRMLAERDENTCRQDFTPSEAVAIAKTLLEMEEQEATKRHATGVKNGGTVAGNGRPKRSSGESFPTAKPRDESARAKSRVAEAVGMSRPTLEKAMAVSDAANSPDATELDKSIAEEMDATGKVDPAFKKHKATPRVHRTDDRMLAEQKKLDSLANSMARYSDMLIASAGLTTKEKNTLCACFDTIEKLSAKARPSHPCAACDGTGDDDMGPCATCHGDGFFSGVKLTV